MGVVRQWAWFSDRRCLVVAALAMGVARRWWAWLSGGYAHEAWLGGGRCTVVGVAQQ